MPPVLHHDLGASGAHRWLNCPGSVKLSRQYPDKSSIYAEEGSIAHAMAEEWINTGAVSPLMLKSADDFYTSHKDLTGSGEVMKRILEPYVDFVQESYNAQLASDEGAELMTEQRVSMEPWIPGGFGTSDVVIIRDGYLHIIDLKYGKGVPVSAEDNPQLKLYALGTMEMLRSIYALGEVRMTIYQPRLDNISTAAMRARELLNWADEVIEPGAKLAMGEDAPFQAGAWCQFCNARKDCRARAEAAQAIAEYMKRATLSNEEIAGIIGHVDELTKWAEDIKDSALEKAMNGEIIPGYKVVEGRANRRYSATDEEIVKAAEAADFKRPMLFESKLLSVSKMEDMMGKKVFAQVLGKMVEKPQGKPTLAPESDKRPALLSKSAAEIAAEFDD